MCEIWFCLEAITHIDQEQTPIINENTEDEQNVKRIIMRCTNLPTQQDEESKKNKYIYKILFLKIYFFSKRRTNDAR
jgi:hypothetical protein